MYHMIHTDHVSGSVETKHNNSVLFFAHKSPTYTPIHHSREESVADCPDFVFELNVPDPNEHRARPVDSLWE